MERKNYVLAVMATAGGTEHTPVQIQKLFFLLDKKIPGAVGGPYFDFVAYDYGPFDSEVYEVIHELEDDGDAETCDGSLRRYKLTAPGQQKGSSLLLEEFDLQTGEYIKKLSAWVRSLSFAELVSAVYQEFPEMKANSVFRG